MRVKVLEAEPSFPQNAGEPYTVRTCKQQEVLDPLALVATGERREVLRHPWIVEPVLHIQVLRRVPLGKSDFCLSLDKSWLLLWHRSHLGSGKILLQFGPRGYAKDSSRCREPAIDCVAPLVN